MKRILIVTGLSILLLLLYNEVKKNNLFVHHETGQAIDSFNNVEVYYNGKVSNVSGRNVKDGYNIGLKYQCVEFVKRYYYEYLGHKMPDSYGHAKSFFDPGVPDGGMNKRRNLRQYTNPGKSKPRLNDLLVFGGSKYGHVAIVSKVTAHRVEIIQQNPGPFAPSRRKFRLREMPGGKWKIEHHAISGWLRK